MKSSWPKIIPGGCHLSDCQEAGFKNLPLYDPGRNEFKVQISLFALWLIFVPCSIAHDNLS